MVAKSSIVGEGQQNPSRSHGADEGSLRLTVLNRSLHAVDARHIQCIADSGEVGDDEVGVLVLISELCWRECKHVHPCDLSQWYQSVQM